jgi:hypothetical protein
MKASRDAKAHVARLKETTMHHGPIYNATQLVAAVHQTSLFDEVAGHLRQGAVAFTLAPQLAQAAGTLREK